MPAKNPPDTENKPLSPSPQRSRNMAAVKGKDTGTERLVRSLLFRAGYRYRLHGKDLPGKPDIVLKAYDAVIFVHGCFWHYHHCPHGSRLPKRNAAYWKKKLEGNKARDARDRNALAEAGYRTLTIYECALRGKHRFTEERLLDEISAFLDSRDIITADIEPAEVKRDNSV